MKALIKVGYACNDHCTFCHTRDVRHIDDTAERIDAKIDRAKSLGYSMVVLSGGEPTIRPELYRWARRIASHGLDFGLVTNGRVLSYPDVVERLLACRLKYVYLSLHGGTPKVHNSLVRAHAFEESFGGIQRVHGRVPVLTVNCVVTRANVDHLESIVDLLLPYPELTLKFSMTQPKGGANRAFDIVVPDVEEAARKVHAALTYGVTKRGNAPGPGFGHDGFPLCLLPGFESLYDDLRTNDFAVMIEVDENDYFPVDDLAKLQTERCQSCALRGPCPGLYDGYFEAYGDACLRPVTRGARSNSYNFVPTKDVMRPPGAPCPLKTDGTTPYDRQRSLFLRLRDRMRLFETRTRDFADVELLAIKEELGQLYVDVSSKLAPDDFSKDLRKLRLLDECSTCEKRPICTGCYAPSREDVFTRDDEAVHAILRSLEGRVLDLGCGEGPYLSTLEPLVREKTIEYLGIEPDEGHASLLSARHPWARIIATRAEEAPTDAVDHILILRSFNHFEEPGRVLDRALEALRPGGTLTIVDNVAFGLVRSRKAARRAEDGPGKLEHYRNDGPEQALRALEGRPLKLIERRDIGAETSNQWLLRFERTVGTV